MVSTPSALYAQVHKFLALFPLFLLEMEIFFSFRLLLVLIGVSCDFLLSSVHCLCADSEKLHHQFPDPKRCGVTNDKNVLHITRLSVALLSAKIYSFRYGTDASDQDLALLSNKNASHDLEIMEEVFASL